MDNSITIRHIPLEPDDDEAINEFELRLREGFKEWARCHVLTPQSNYEQLRATLIEQIMRKAASLITVDAVAKIHGAEGSDVGRQLAAGIRDELSRFIYTELVAMSGAPRRGRPRQFAERDREIYQKHRSGSSYGKIAYQLGISRHAVQAACRRERDRRGRLCRDYPKLKQSLAALGIILKQAKA